MKNQVWIGIYCPKRRGGYPAGAPSLVCFRAGGDFQASFSMPTGCHQEMSERLSTTVSPIIRGVQDAAEPSVQDATEPSVQDATKFCPGRGRAFCPRRSFRFSKSLSASLTAARMSAGLRSGRSPRGGLPPYLRLFSSVSPRVFSELWIYDPY